MEYNIRWWLYLRCRCHSTFVERWPIMEDKFQNSSFLYNTNFQTFLTTMCIRFQNILFLSLGSLSKCTFIGFYHHCLWVPVVIMWKSLYIYPFLSCYLERGRCQMSHAIDRLLLIALMGGFMIKRKENFRTMALMGGGVKKQTKMSEIQIRTFENPWGGGLNFSKKSEL